MAAMGFLLFLAFWVMEGVSGSLMAGVRVPALAVSGGRVNISCSFDFGSTGLYSLKWYHNDSEFYRYVPTEKDRPVDIRPTITFQAHELTRTDTEVSLSLTSLTGDATGEYKCEVIAEHPSFRTETASATMTVLDTPLPPPRLVGGGEVYEGGDTVRVRCEASPLPLTTPLPSLTWYLDGVQVRREYVSEERGEGVVGMMGAPMSSPVASTLIIPAAQVWRDSSERGRGGKVVGECVLRLSGHEVRSKVVLRVRHVPSSLFSNYFSGGGLPLLPSHNVVLACFLTVFWMKS